jgi:hypothetical protein
MNSARADVFRVDLLGTYTSTTPPSPFAYSFYVDTSATACAPSCVIPFNNPGGAPFVGYVNAALSGISPITAGGQSFSKLIAPDPQVSTAAMLLSSQPLATNASPDIILAFVNDAWVRTHIGKHRWPPWTFSTLDPILLDPPPNIGSQQQLGTFVVHVTGFAGTPGTPQCHDSSTSALAHKYGSIPQAAVALSYSNVKSLQADITLFCGS